MRKIVLLISLLFSLTALIYGQADSLVFLQAWVGKWSGELVISGGQGELQRLPMALDIQLVADSTYTYTIIYGEDIPENRRNYLLQTVNATKGHFQVDEQNGIILDNYFIAGKLYSRFSVMGNLLLATIEQRDDTLIYEIISGPLEPVAITGDTVVKEEEIPPVESYSVRVQQRAVLTRKN